MMSMGVTSLATGCGRQCKEARRDILEPTDAVISYLETNPSGEELKESGCPLILEQMESIPSGAELIRSIAERRFSHTNSYCLRWETSTRLVCNHHARHGRGRWHRPGHCWSERYNYCVAWEYDHVREPGYAEAMDLSTNLEVMADRANQACESAASGDTTGAYDESRALLAYILTDVKPTGDRVYAMACGE